MHIKDSIPLDKAELLAVILEALLYGFSLTMFGAAVWALSSQRSTPRMNYKMLAVACSLLLFSTLHLVIDVIRVMEGFIYLPVTYEGGRIGYFSDMSHWTFMAKNYIYAPQALIGDSVVLYRCYAVWQSKVVMILPALLWCAATVTGFACLYAESRIKGGDVFGESLSQWIPAFWASALATNTVTTAILAYRIWNVDRKVTRLCDNRRPELRPILIIIIDAGAIYSIALSAALICYVKRSNSEYIMVDVIMPVISITFYMIIIRVGLANRKHQTAPAHSFGHTSSGHNLAGERRSRVQIDITALTESKIDNGRRSSLSQMTPISESSENHRRSEIKF